MHFFNRCIFEILDTRDQKLKIVNNNFVVVNFYPKIVLIVNKLQMFLLALYFSYALLRDTVPHFTFITFYKYNSYFLITKNK